jgi:hypothetical protein
VQQTANWEDEIYARVFEDELRMLERRFANNASSNIAEVEAQLKSLYVSEGNNWEGRGPIGDITFAATIAAFEQFIANYKYAGRRPEFATQTS